MNDVNERNPDYATYDRHSSPSAGKTLILLGASFVAGYLLGRRRVEGRWDAGETVEITEPVEEPSDVAGPTGGAEAEMESGDARETAEEVEPEEAADEVRGSDESDASDEDEGGEESEEMENEGEEENEEE